MTWGDYIKRTAVRRVVWVVVGLAVYAALSVFGVARAQAAPGNICPAGAGCSVDVAYSNCMAEANWYVIATNRDPGSGHCFTPNPNQAVGVWTPRARSNGTTISAGSDRYWYSSCPNGGAWRADLERCFNENECQARNQMEGFLNVGSVTKPFESKCIDGCRYSSSDAQCTSLSAVSGAQMCTGIYQWGASCSADPPGPGDAYVPDTYDTVEGTAEEGKKEQRCIPVSGQNVCLKKSGEVCYTASTGRQICWETTETGEKDDSSTRQIRRAGSTEIPPSNPNLPSGDVLEKVGESVTTTTTKGSQSTTTTTTNYQTQFGTNPGKGDQGQPADGSGTSPGEGDDDKGSVTGGGDCEIPPIVRGGDPIAGAVLEQTWETRCAVEAGNAAKVTGDINKCHEPFTVEGTNANAVKLRAMREQICKEGERSEREGISTGLDAVINSMEGEFTVEDIWGDGSGDGGQGISTTRYGGGGACPVLEITIPGINQTWTPPPQFCSLIAALRLLFITVATVWGLRIIGS